MRLNRSVGVALLLGGSIAIVSVASCLSFSDLTGGDGGAAGDASSFGDVGADATAISDAGPSDDGNVPIDADTFDAACVSTDDEPATRVGSGPGSYCIDTTEVTLIRYRAFLAATDGGATAFQPPECAWNTNLVAGAARIDLFSPINGVDWCDAFAFCNWSGRRLCGAIGGGAVPAGSLGDPSKSQWLHACSLAPDGGTQLYPYGNVAKAKACNGAEHDAGKILPVASLPDCDGGVPGVFDMSGNVDEWIDLCVGSSGASDCCASEGGGFNDTETPCGIGDVFSGACTNRHRSDVHSDVGFRCCSD